MVDVRISEVSTKTASFNVEFCNLVCYYIFKNIQI